MKRLAYREANYGNLTVTGTSEGTATEIIGLPDQSFDGATEILLEFNFMALGATLGFDVVLVLFDGETAIGELYRAEPWTAPGAQSGQLLFRVLTPSAGVHRYSVRGWFETGGSLVIAGDKASENAAPISLRAYALDGPGTNKRDSIGTRVEVGFFQPSSAVEQKTITLIDEDFGDVKLLLLFTVAQASPADTDGDAILSAGVGSYRGGAVQQYCSSLFSDDGVGTSATAIGGSTSSIVRGYSAATPTVDFDIALVSLGDAQFRVDVTDLPATAGIRVYYMALGGSQVTDSLLSAVNVTAVTGTQDVTVAAGFGLPDLLLALIGHPPGGDAAANIRFQLGAGKSDTEMAVTGFNQDNGTANMELSSYQASAFLATPNNDTAMAQVATLSARSSWPTDGYQINKSVAGLALASLAVAALRGTFKSIIGSGTVPTAGGLPVVQDIPVGATPRGALFFHNVLPATAAQDNSHADLGLLGIGIMDGVREYWIGFGNDDGNTTSIAHRHASEQKTIRMFTPAAAGTLTSEADGSFFGESVRLSWNDIEASIAREYRYVVFGEAREPRHPAINFQDPGIL